MTVEGEQPTLELQCPILYSNGHWRLTVDKKMLLSSGDYSDKNFFDFLTWLDRLDYTWSKRINPYSMSIEQNNKEIEKDMQEYVDEIQAEKLRILEEKKRQIEETTRNNIELIFG